VCVCLGGGAWESPPGTTKIMGRWPPKAGAAANRELLWPKGRGERLLGIPLPHTLPATRPKTGGAPVVLKVGSLGGPAAKGWGGGELALKGRAPGADAGWGACQGVHHRGLGRDAPAKAFLGRVGGHGCGGRGGVRTNLLACYLGLFWLIEYVNIPPQNPDNTGPTAGNRFDPI